MKTVMVANLMGVALTLLSSGYIQTNNEQTNRDVFTDGLTVQILEEVEPIAARKLRMVRSTHILCIQMHACLHMHSLSLSTSILVAL